MGWRIPALGGVSTDVALDAALGPEPGMPGAWERHGTGRVCWWPGGVCAAVVERAPGGWRVAVWGAGGASEWRGAILLPADDAEQAQAVAMRILRAWAQGRT